MSISYGLDGADIKKQVSKKKAGYPAFFMPVI